MENGKKQVVIRLSPSVSTTLLQRPFCFEDELEKYTIDDAVKYILNTVQWKETKHRSLVDQLKKDLIGKEKLNYRTHKKYVTGKDAKTLKPLHKCESECKTDSVLLSEGIDMEYLSLSYSPSQKSQGRQPNFYMLDLTLAKKQSGGEE